MNGIWTRRNFLGTGAGAWLGSALAGRGTSSLRPLDLPEAHREAVRRRKRRIVVQHDAHDVLCGYAKLHPDGAAPFAPFCDALFSYADEPGSQIDAIWWDIGGSPVGGAYPSELYRSDEHPLLKQWLRDGVDWVTELVAQTRRRRLEVFWNHRISEVEVIPTGGADPKHSDPLKQAHPDWVTPATWWPSGMWNLASAGLRDHKVAILRELVSRYDFDGIQIDFSRHVPCLPLGRQQELRDQATDFMRMVRVMLLQVEKQRGHPVLLAAKVPQTIEGCRADGFDVESWADQRLVDILTLGSRSMDVDVEGLRASVGGEIQLQACFDDHHATDGYRHGSIEFLRGVFANHLQRGADGVVTFNWSIGAPDVAKSVGGEVGPLSHQLAYKEIGDLQTMARKDKIYAVERRGGYPWADGFFNRNDAAPLPALLKRDGGASKFILHISDARAESKSYLMLRCILFQASDHDAVELRLGGVALPRTIHDAEWKDPQIFSPKPQPPSGGKGDYKIDPMQRLVRLEFTVPALAWRAGANEVEIRLSPAEGGEVQIEKLEAHLHYPQGPS